MKVVGYCRVSTANQREEGTIDIQRQALSEFAEQRGWKLTKTFEDEGVSGGLENRTGLSALFDFLEDEENEGVEAVLIYKLDRLARDLYLQEHLIRKLESLGKELISTKEPDLASGDPMRKAFRQFMGIVSELEKAFITMRLSAGRQSKIKNKGMYTGGGVPLGYKVKEKDLIVDFQQAKTVKRIFEMRRSGKGLTEIARTLNEEGVPTARGGKWYAGTVKYILENSLYQGKMSYSGIEAERSDLAVVS
ncbi:MAG: recombinase family protein [Bacilli bacterium]